VQIVEATEGWVRVAELRLRRRGTPLRFVLYPMIHIGEPAFYAEVRRRLADVDLVVAEGVGGGRAVEGLTSVYRGLGEDPASGVVVQDDVFPPGVPVLCPDSSGADFVPQPSAGRCPQAPSTCAPSCAASASGATGSTPPSGSRPW
jgi:hypothetical protein